jgi:hypothetical protein
MINARADFLPVESIWPWVGSQGLPTRQNAPVSQILTLAPAFHGSDRPAFYVFSFFAQS